MRSPFTGLTTSRPSGTPVFWRSSSARSSAVARADSLTYSRTACSCSVPSARRSTIGCSGARTKKVAPKSVSGRVVKTGKSISSSSQRKITSAPSERPIQFRCIVTTFSGHDSSRSKSSRSCCAYSVIRKNHCSSLRCSTSVPQRSQCPSITCSLASTVWSFGHHCTGASWRWARPRSYSFRKIHCVQR